MKENFNWRFPTYVGEHPEPATGHLLHYHIEQICCRVCGKGQLDFALFTMVASSGAIIPAIPLLQCSWSCKRTD
jgi:hypothetical protein